MTAFLTAVLGVLLSLSLSGCGAAAPTRVAAQAAETQANAREDIQIVDSGWSVSDGNLTYGAIVRNPNADWRCERATLHVVGRDAEGRKVFGFLEDAEAVGAGSECALGDIACGDAADVAAVEFSVEVDESDWAPADGEPAPSYDLSSVERVPAPSGMVADELLVGTVTPDEDGPVWVTVIARDGAGAIVGGAAAYMEPEGAGKETRFQANCWLPRDGVASYKAYASPTEHNEG